MMLTLTVIVSIVALIASAEGGKILSESDIDKLSCQPYETECALGCCPYPDAVCCSDGYECCPSGTSCIPYVGICVGFNEKNETVRYGKPVLIKSYSPNQNLIYQYDTPVEDDDKIRACPSGTTPCGIGCCPLPNAICCSDGIHCCPNGYICNYKVGKCTSGSDSAPFFQKFENISLPEFENSVMISTASDDHRLRACPSRAGRCITGCCPASDDVCCSDNVHCCPGGYTCNYAAGSCTSGTHSSPFLQQTKQFSLRESESVAMTSNDLGNHQIQACPSRITPCGAECCPMPSAVCCSDGIHCCPNGYTCNYVIGGCVRGKSSTRFLQKPRRIFFVELQNSAMTSASGATPYFYQLMACPSRSTRCIKGCCPMPGSVCCSDNVHCCPGGYICNYAAGGCTKNSHFTPFLRRIQNSVPDLENNDIASNDLVD